MNSIFYIVTFVAILSFIPKLKSTHWAVRGMDFVKIQLSFIQLVAFIISIWGVSDNIIFFIPLALLIIALYSNLKRISPYTPFKKVEVEQIKIESIGYSILVANVFQDNKYKSNFIERIKELRPTLFVTLESNEEWEKAFDILDKQYPYSIKFPLENYYGIHLYSKIPLKKSKVQFIYKDNIPSIVCDLKLNNTVTTIYCVHPEPPSPTENTYSDDRDAELMRIAKQVRRDANSVIVCGDMNDVAWSATTALFKKLSGLKDPRVGRGLYSTFSAHLPIFLRFPVDQIFCTQDILCQELKTIKIKGSDHLGILYKFAITKKVKEKFSGPSLNTHEKAEIINKLNLIVAR